MAAYAQQQRQAQQQFPQQFGDASYLPGQPQPVANSSQGQMSPASAGHPDWQAQQAHHQAWEQSQLYEYQPQQQPQTPGWQQSSPPPQQYQPGQQAIAFGQQSQQPQQPQQFQQEPDASSPQRHSSFVGLPPIRRTSTLLSSVVHAGQINKDNNSSSGVSSSEQPNQGQQVTMGHAPTVNQHQMPMPMPVQMQGQMQSIPQQLVSGAYRPMVQQGQSQAPQGQQSFQNTSAYVQNMHVALQNSVQAQHGFQQQGLPGVSGPSFSGQGAAYSPQGVAVMNGDGRSQAQGQAHGQSHGQAHGQQLPGSSQQPFATQGMRPQQPASVLPNAGDQIRLPPRGAWKLEESHLQQPLLSANRNRSASNTSTQNSPQPYYGYDKETGLPLSSSPSMQQQQQLPQGSLGGQGPHGNPQGHQGQEAPQVGQPVSRTDTGLSADSDFETPVATPAGVAYEDQARRSSGIFSGIRERFSKDGSDGRRDPSIVGAAAPSPSFPSAPQQQGPVLHDAVSESSVSTEEIQERSKRHSILGIQGPSQLSQPPRQYANGPSPPAGSRPVVDGGRLQGPSGPYDPRTQQPQTYIAPQRATVRPDAPRPATSFASIQQTQAEQEAGGKPKKRFSNLKDMFHRSAQQDQGQAQGQRPLGSALVSRPSETAMQLGQPAPGLGPQNMHTQPYQGQAPFQGGQVMVGQQQSGPPAQFAQGGQQLRQQPQQFLRKLQPGQEQQPGQQGPPGQQQLQAGQYPQDSLQGRQPQQLQQGQPNSPAQQLGHERGPLQAVAATPQSNGQKPPQNQEPFPVSNTAQQQQQPGQQQLQPTAQQYLQHQFSQQAQHQQHVPQPQQQRQQQRQQQQEQQQQLGLMAPAPAITGRGRSGSTGSGRPLTPGSRPNPMMQTSSSGGTNEERGRKPSSAGGFLSSFFSGRSGSKPRDPKKEQTQGQQLQGPGQLQPQPQQQQMAFQPSQQPSGQQPSQFGQNLGQQPPPGPGAQFRKPSPNSQGQQTGPRPAGPAGQPMGQPQLVSRGVPGQQQQFVQMQGRAPGQQAPPASVQQGGQAGQQMQSQTGGPRPMMVQQQSPQQSQISSAPGSVVQNRPQGQQFHQRIPSQAGQQLSPGLQNQQQRPLGPLNQHPVTVSPGPPGHSYPAPTQGMNHIAMHQSQQAANRRMSGSPQLGSPVSQLSQSAPFTPVEPSRQQQADSPLGFGQPLQQQQTGQSLQAPSLALTAPSSPRKPVPASPRRSEQSTAGGDQGSQIDQVQRSPNVSALNSVQNSPIQHSRKPSTQNLAPQAGSPLVQKQQQPQQRLASRGSSPSLSGAPHVGLEQHPFSAGQGVPQQRFRPGQTPGTPMAGQQGQFQPGPQPPWMLTRTGTGASGPVPPQQQGPPQTGTLYFQAYPPSNASSKEHQSSISKFFKGKTFGPGQSEKEKSGVSSLFGLRKLKQSESNLKISHPIPLQGGPQPPQQGQVQGQGLVPGSMVQATRATPPEDRLPQPSAGTSPSPGPHMQYQHQRQSPSGTPPGQTPPLSTPSSQGPPGAPPHPQQPNATGPQQSGPAPGQFQRAPQSFPGQPQRVPLNGAPGGQPMLLNQRQMSIPPKTSEPQYGEVPIPGGYGFVRAEGRVEPPPAAYSVAYHVGPNGQHLPVQSGVHGPPQPGQPWMQPGTTPGQGPPPAPVAPVNTPSLQQAPRGGLAQQRQAQAETYQPTRAVSPLAQGQTPQPTPNPGAQSPVSLLQSPTLEISTLEMNTDPHGVPRLTNASLLSPQSQDPAAANPPDAAMSDASLAKLVPAPVKTSDQLGIPSRQPSAVSQLSNYPPPGPTPAAGDAESENSLQATPERIVVSPEPPSQLPPPRMNISVQQANRHHVEHENYYAATPRTDSVPSQQPSQEPSAPSQQPSQEPAGYIMTAPAAPEEPAEPKSAGPSHGVLEHRGQGDPNSATPQHRVVESTVLPTPSPPPAAAAATREPEPEPEPEAVPVIASEPIIAAPASVHPPIMTSKPVVASEPVISSTPGPSQQQPLTVDTAQTNGFTQPPKQATTNPNPMDVFEEARRKAFLRDMEEKIPVFPTEPDMEAHARAETEARKKQEEKPQMSATSYPGQEWNPYGDGIEEWE